ncbi:sialin-like isoform X2 [Sitophilus oryzae]|uniref:Sialin-like isoform X2 n=1 Tax=Sitophilus oryzae TaxID=7048 RepID=A0A6J2YL49_SITOR|nr:sialin-like isoform X2 [Sitophilus oryzae]
MGDHQTDNGIPMPKSGWKFWKQRRNILAILVFFEYFNLYSVRVNLSIGIVAMTQDVHVTLPNGTKENIGPEFSWDNKIQGYLLSSFFYGYIMTQIAGGYLSKKFGGKLVFGGGVAGAALFTLLSPLFATINVYLFLAGRIFMGIFGVTYSSLFYLWSKWIPPSERSRYTSQSTSGSQTGAVFAMVFYAYLADISGWRSIFYFSGGMALIWSLIWIILIKESPESDKWISHSELHYIQQSLKDAKPVESFPVPWKNILICKAVWALQVAIFCEAWGFYTLLTLLPKYYKDVHNFVISKSGILSALPYLVLAIMMQVTGHLADKIVQWNILGITYARKTFMALGFLCQSCLMLGAAFWEEATGNVICLVLAVGMDSFALTIISVNVLDLAPVNASILIGLVYTWGVIPGIMSPIIAGYLISTDNHTVQQWRVIFYITASLYLFGALFFVIFASGLRQSWDIPPKIDPNDSTRIENPGISRNN